MKNYFNSFKKSAWVVSALLVCASCSDTWDDHYSTDYSIVPRETLAEKISSLDNTGEFVEILKNTYMFNGNKMLSVTYYDYLDQDQFLTVWVPSDEAVETIDDSLLTRFKKPIYEKTREDHEITGQEFIQNYIARYSHPVGGEDGKIFMLSKKFYTTTADKIDNVSYLKTNVACRNGILHTLNGRIEYRKSLYEYLTTQPEYSDVVGKFFSKYTKEEIDPNRSVQYGVNENGEMEYVDSVLVKKSVLMDRFGFINEEDSNFAMILPTPEAWKATFDSISKHYDYGTMEYADSFRLYWTQNAIMTDMFFNMNIQHHAADSVMSTTFNRYSRMTEPIAYHTYYQPYAEGGLFVDGRVDSIKCSNGYIIKVDKWPFIDSLTWALPIKLEGEDALSMVKDKNDVCLLNTKSMRKGQANGYVSGEKYLEISGEKGTYTWQVEFNIKNNLKGKYRVYLVLAPNLDSNKPIQIHPTINYKNAVLFNPCDSRNRALAFNNVAGNTVDTILVAGNNSSKVYQDYIEIPNCDYDTQKPKLSIKLECSMKQSDLSKYYTTVNLDCIILEPVLE